MTRPAGHLTVADRFWAKVLKGAPDECWLWQGWTNNHGYGRIYILERDSDTGAHVVSWFLHTGSWPEKGMCVLHNCPEGDNPACVNIAHLWLGTKADNTHDMMRKGRHGHITHPERLARGERNGRHTHPERTRRGDNHPYRLHPELHAHGENNPHTKLNDNQRQELCELYLTGQWTIAKLAQRYGVTWRAIRNRLSVDIEHTKLPRHPKRQ
jgi:hypothetical protein